MTENLDKIVEFPNLGSETRLKRLTSEERHKEEMRLEFQNAKDRYAEVTNDQRTYLNKNIPKDCEDEFNKTIDGIIYGDNQFFHQHYEFLKDYAEKMVFLAEDSACLLNEVPKTMHNLLKLLEKKETFSYLINLKSATTNLADEEDFHLEMPYESDDFVKFGARFRVLAETIDMAYHEVFMDCGETRSYIAHRKQSLHHTESIDRLWEIYPIKKIED